MSPGEMADICGDDTAERVAGATAAWNESELNFA